MNEKVVAFRVGVVVLAAACLAVLLIFIFGGGQSVLQRRYTIYLSFPRAPGVSVDTPIRKNGVLIGRVSDVELYDDHVILTARIDGNRRLRRNEICRITTASLLGDSVLEFVPSGVQGASPEFIQPEELLADGVVASDPLQVLTNLEDNIVGALGSMKSAADEVSVLAGGLNQTLGNNDQQLQRILTKSEEALDTFNGTMQSLDDIIGDPQLRESLKQTLADLPKTLQEIQLTANEARQALNAFEQVGLKAERNLDNLEGFTRPLREQGDRLIADLSRGARNLDEALSQLVTFGEAINSSDGTLGRLIRDDQLYGDIREMVSNLNAASRRIRPILEDVRIFTDKISRDPRQLGIKGALDRNPSGTGVKLPLSPSPSASWR